MANIEKLSLLHALSNMFAETVTNATFETEILQGGTVGDVSHLSGKATTKDGDHPYHLVVKTQGKWERYGDPDCWRREYNIYKTNMFRDLSDQIKLPKCYFLEEEQDLTRIWMEYIEGCTGNKKLHGTELAFAAERLGAFQADFHLNGSRDLHWLRGYPAVRSSFELWHNRISSLLQNVIEGFPDELRHILNTYAQQSHELLDTFDKLPLTLCQGDVHHDNLIFKEITNRFEVYLIDWDCAGYGRMGEDAVDVLMEAFVYSDRDVSLLPDFRRCIIEGYCRGVKGHNVDFNMSDSLVRDIFALAWGFRIADLYLYYKEEKPKRRCVEILYAMLK